MTRLNDRIAVVTGASKGIGAGIARRLAAEGASVIVNYASSRADADRVVAAITASGGKAEAIGASVTDPAALTELFAQVKARHGRVDVLVNNAGVYAPTPVGELTGEAFDRHFNTNVRGLLHATDLALKLFPESGGAIVNISSVVSTLAPPGLAVYSATKGAVDTITRTLAKDLAPRGIRVNSVNPGFVITEGTHAAGMAGSAFETDVVAQTPLGRPGRPEDIAAAVAFLASADASWITGESLVVAGGLGM